jgi:hypothetical protein
MRCKTNALQYAAHDRLGITSLPDRLRESVAAPPNKGHRCTMVDIPAFAVGNPTPSSYLCGNTDGRPADTLSGHAVD